MTYRENTIEPVPPARCHDGSVSDHTKAYPTHKHLISKTTGKITAVMDCFGGPVLRVFNRRWDIGEKVQSGGIRDRQSDTMQVETKFWIITGYSSWQAAKAMTRKIGPEVARMSLSPGVWHEVISE